MQSIIRGRRKLEGREQRSGQFELLASTNDMGPDRATISLRTEEVRARTLMRKLVSSDKAGLLWGSLWPLVLSQCVIRLTDLKRIANEDRRASVLEFPTWPNANKRVPEDNYLVRIGSVATMQGFLL